ncbi:uncharacterized protein LOC133746292 isoform X3 [Rosa rugosa]|uniref:uncharacterized protein LOC133729736 n=1 Tax=Rosa rugosa TaxID=74645 RepID=UPI002B401197|nr:uncharacterized protein LOC133729736 [Rosa rugosa]XP_062030456.1 uncharacterized protein LOC133746292 isoform X3 [Rosa rugosa]
MASNNRKLKGKRYLRMNDGPNDNDQQNVQNALDGHTTATFFDNNINRRIKSRRWIEVSEAVVEDSRVKQHNDDGINVIQHRDKRVRNNRETSNVTMKRTTVTEANSNGNGQGGTGEHLHSFGQASYQSTRQDVGLIDIEKERKRGEEQCPPDLDSARNELDIARKYHKWSKRNTTKVREEQQILEDAEKDEGERTSPQLLGLQSRSSGRPYPNQAS